MWAAPSGHPLGERLSAMPARRSANRCSTGASASRCPTRMRSFSAHGGSPSGPVSRSPFPQRRAPGHLRLDVDGTWNEFSAPRVRLPFLPHHETGLARGASGTTHVRLRRVRAAGSAGGAFTALSREPRQRRGHLLEPPRRGGPIHRQGHAPLHVHRAASAGGYTFWLNSMRWKAVAGASVNVSALERIVAIAGGSPRRLAELQPSATRRAPGAAARSARYDMTCPRCC